MMMTSTFSGCVFQLHGRLRVDKLLTPI